MINLRIPHCVRSSISLFIMSLVWSSVIFSSTLVVITSESVSLYLNGLSVQPEDVSANCSGHIPKNVIPTRIETYNNEVFLTYPRYRRGVPFTLGVINLESRNREIVRPFPHQAMQTLGDCRALQSVEDMFLDEDNVLWVLDSGIIESIERPYCICPPKVVGFSILTGRLLQVIDLSNVLGAQARLQFLGAEKIADGSICVYVSDTDGPSLWSIRVNIDPGVRCSSNQDPVETRRIQLPTPVRCDILYMVLLKTMLLLHCRGANAVMAVHTSKLHTGQVESAMVRLGPSPAAADLVFLGTDRQHTLYYRFEGKNEILSWDTRVSLSAATKSVVATCAELDARLSVAAVSLAGRRLVALAVDYEGFVSGRVGCVGAEARIFNID